MVRIWILFLISCVAVSAAEAQPANTTVVGCLTAANPGTTPDNNYTTVLCDANGRLITSSGGGASSTTANQGTAGANTAPWYVRSVDGTGADNIGPVNAAAYSGSGNTNLMAVSIGQFNQLANIYSRLTPNASTAANQTTQITAEQAIQTQVTNANTRDVNYTELNGSLASGATSTVTARTPGAAYTKFNGSAGCDQPGTLQIRGSIDGFANFTTLGTATVPAGSRNTTGVIGPTITVPATYTSFAVVVTNTNTTAGNCTIVSSATMN